MTYRQITSEERYMLSALRKQGLNNAEIARQLGRHPGSIGREIKRNSCNDGHYRPFKASQRTRGRRSRSRRNRRFGAEEWALVEPLLGKDWSPEQVSGYLKGRGSLQISHETIYQHIWRDKRAGGSLYQHLRCAQKRRRKRYRSYDSRGRLAGKRNIAERPAGAENRSRIGHWEGDTVMGSGDKHCVVTLVERKTGWTEIGKLPNRTKEAVTKRLIQLIKKQPRPVYTITLDNGTEFHDYKKVEHATGVKIYFANPHHSWERGTNENTNGLIRQYLPKKESMAAIDQWSCNDIGKKLNTRPRKRLRFKTPEECYEKK